MKCKNCGNEEFYRYVTAEIEGSQTYSDGSVEVESIGEVTSNGEWYCTECGGIAHE